MIGSSLIRGLGVGTVLGVGAGVDDGVGVGDGVGVRPTLSTAGVTAVAAGGDSGADDGVGAWRAAASARATAVVVISASAGLGDRPATGASLRSADIPPGACVGVAGTADGVGVSPGSVTSGAAAGGVSSGATGCGERSALVDSLRSSNEVVGALAPGTPDAVGSQATMLAPSASATIGAPNRRDAGKFALTGPSPVRSYKWLPGDSEHGTRGRARSFLVRNGLVRHQHVRVRRAHRGGRHAGRCRTRGLGSRAARHS